MRPAQSRLIAAVAALSWGLIGQADGHDIPNARVDRSIQIRVHPGRLAIVYEVSLAELTLTQDLRRLIGVLPEGDRESWFRRYGDETATLNAKGLLVSVDGELRDLVCRGFDLIVEEHPRYLYRYEVSIPPEARLRVQDINFASSEGTSRLAAVGDGVVLDAEGFPTDVSLVPIRPAWDLTDEEERRTREFDAHYRGMPDGVESPPPPESLPKISTNDERLSSLLDRASGSTWLLVVLAVLLGSGHALQPGHGKMLVATSVLGQSGAWWRGLALAVITTITHFAAVVLVAIALWLTRSTRYAEWDGVLTRIAGFVIASIGLWRLGRIAGGFPSHHAEDHPGRAGGLIGIGVAGGIVPCWDAITLIVVAEAIGRLGLGLLLLAGFSLGMAAVLTAVGLAAGLVRGSVTRRDPQGTIGRYFATGGALALTLLGLYLFGA